MTSTSTTQPAEVPARGHRVLYLDCVGGVAGDMLVAALTGAGADPAALEALPARLGFPDVALRFFSERRGGLRARRFEVAFEPDRHPHTRGLAEVEALLDRAAVGEPTSRRAKRVFRRLAEAEAEAHGVPPEEVHFHEVGAVDAVIDVLGTCLALDALGIDQIVCSPLPMGSGTIAGSHGLLPLPAPAVAALLPGVPVRDAGIRGETVTPTGAALVRTLARRFGSMPAMTVEAVGVGGGSRDQPGRPNILRAFVGRAAAAAPIEEVETRVVECALDDLDPRLFPVVLEHLLAAGALDAWITPVVMKKGRPGHLFSALTGSATLEATVQVLLRETTTLGCRIQRVERRCLERRMETVRTPWGEVGVKLALLGGEVLRRMPELDDCARVAGVAGVPLRDVLAAAGGAGVPEEED